MTDNHPTPIRELREPREFGDLTPPTGYQMRLLLDNFIRAAEEGQGVTDNEGIALLDISQSSYRTRRNELEQEGWVRNSGYSRRTPGVEGSKRGVVWVLSPKGGEQAGLENYKPMRAGRTDRTLIKQERKSQPPRRSPARPDPAPGITPEEMEMIRKRNRLQECRVLIERCVHNFTDDQAPDPEDFGAFLGNDGIGSPGFSPWEIQRVARFLGRVAGAYDRNRMQARPRYQNHHREES